MDKNYMQFAGYRNYLAKSWINIVEMLAKNNNNIPLSWVNDLEMANYFMQSKIIPRMIKEGGKPIYNNNEIIGVNYNYFTYMYITNEDYSKKYINDICKFDNLKTTEDIMMNNPVWNNIKISLDILHNYKDYGYNRTIANNYMKCNSNILDKAIKAINKPTLIKQFITNKYNTSEPQLYGLFSKNLKNKNLNDFIFKDNKNEFLDASDMIYNLTEKACDIIYNSNVDIKSRNDIIIEFDDNFINTIKDISECDQLYMYIDNKRFYLPIIEYKGKYINFEELNTLLENMTYSVYGYSSNGDYINYCNESKDIISNLMSIDISEEANVLGYDLNKILENNKNISKDKDELEMNI